MGVALLAGVMALLAFVAPAGLWAAGETVVVNGDFENGTNGWACKQCSLATGSPAQDGAAGQMTTTKVSGRAQLLQNNIVLQPDTTYELKFWAQSNKGQDLQVTLLRQSSPYTNYGIKPQNFNVTQSGQEFTVTFTTTGFTEPVSDARLRFRADKGKGKVYS
ncbi:MAG: carbohydrate binding domain-containing protein, partial [Candidatus Promineofilum sp.]|nr:carbohydrate binding domain-containing protein [Promineifilum sp.]